MRYPSHVFAFLSLVATRSRVHRARERLPARDRGRAPERSGGSSRCSGLLLAIPALSAQRDVATSCWPWPIGGWFASLITGRMPSGLRALGAVIIRYSAQVTAYLLVVTDHYPNSSLGLRGEPAPAAEQRLRPHRGPGPPAHGAARRRARTCPAPARPSRRRAAVTAE